MVVALVADGTSLTCPFCGVGLNRDRSYDVFISYARPDEKTALRLAALLDGAGVRYWLDVKDLGLDSSFIGEIAKVLSNSKVLLLLVSPRMVDRQWVEAEVSFAMRTKCLILPLMLEEFDLPINLQLALGTKIIRKFYQPSSESQDRELVRFVYEELQKYTVPLTPPPSCQSITAAPLVPKPLKGVVEGESPFMGPRPFEGGMSHLFFGRDSEVLELLGLMRKSRVLLLYAPSGAGKSSLLNTRFQEVLQGQGVQVLNGIRVGTPLPENVDRFKVKNIYAFSVISQLDKRDVDHSTRRLRDCLQAMRQEGRPRIILFDQFEEIFTQHADRFDERVPFIQDLIGALTDDPLLTVLFAIRQEYLAYMFEFRKLFPAELPMLDYALRRMGVNEAKEAILGPASTYAIFDSDVVDEIIKQLNIMRVIGPHGELVEKPGPNIELVHLQIVCEQLWASLESGIKRITKTELARAAGNGKRFEDFVQNALNVFFEKVLDEVSRHNETEKKMIQFGLMSFITASSTRTMVQRGKYKTGRLPNRIVEKLEGRHLIRREERGGQQWFELSHDSLADPVSKQRAQDPELNKLLFAADLLDKVLDKAKVDSSDTLKNYFGEHREILAECKRFQSQAQSLLEEEELEFLFRASLRSGIEQLEWSEQLWKHYPESHVRVLKNALSYYSPSVSEVARTVRKHAMELLGKIGERADKDLLSMLVEVALKDEDANVRQAATLSLVRLDQQELYLKAISALSQLETQAVAMEALARIRITIDGQTERTRFDEVFAGIPSMFKGKIRARARWIRLKERWPAIPITFFTVATFAAIAAAPFKVIPGGFGWSVTQYLKVAPMDTFNMPNAFMGFLQGTIAAVIWAGGIAIALMIYHEVFQSEQTKKSILSPIGTIVAGATGGLCASLVVVLGVLFWFNPMGIVGMGWRIPIEGSEVLPPNGGAVKALEDAFVNTRYGWVHLFSGTGLGIGMGMMLNAIRSSSAWNEFFDRQHVINSFTEARQFAWVIMKIALKKVWIMLVVLGAAASVAALVPNTELSELPKYKAMVNANLVNLIKGLIGDCSTQAFGAYFGIVGMLLATVALRYGINIEPRKNRI